MNTLLDAALSYRQRGWSVIPTVRKVSRGCRWKAFQKAAPTPEVISQLFARDSVDGVAVITGAVSGGLAIRDFDQVDAYDRWARDHTDLAGSLPTVKTGKGFHVYATAPRELFVDMADGEYRGDSGHYTLVPPSRHPSGATYTWTVPLPDGPLPIVDPVKAGFLPSGKCNTGSSCDAEFTGYPEYPVLQDIFLQTIPGHEGQRHKSIFLLARHLKSNPAYAGMTMVELRPIVQEWHRQALPTIKTKDFVETWADFLESWKGAKVLIGQGVIEMAFERALSNPVARVVAMYGEHGPINLLASLCRELQIIAGEKEFYLDCRTAGRLIGVDHVQAWRYLNVLVVDGILIPGVKGSLQTRKASCFRYID